VDVDKSGLEKARKEFAEELSSKGLDPKLILNKRDAVVLYSILEQRCSAKRSSWGQRGMYLESRLLPLC